MTICVCPRLDVDVMLSMPAIVENCFSSGVATVAAIVCGLVPGSVALTVTVGKSTFGRSLTGSCRYATMPKTRIADHDERRHDGAFDEQRGEIH